MAAAVLPTSHHVDDVLQEAFSRVLRSRREFASGVEAYKYLRTSVLNTAIDFYRRLRRQRRTFLACDPWDIYCPSSEHEDPLNRLIRAEQSDRRRQLVEEVEAAIGHLTPEQQEAIHAFFGKRRQSSLKEYCMETGVSYSTLRSRMLHGIDRIREQLRERDIEGFLCGEEDPS